MLHNDGCVLVCIPFGPRGLKVTLLSHPWWSTGGAEENTILHKALLDPFRDKWVMRLW